MCGNENGENEYDNQPCEWDTPHKDTQKISKNWNIANDDYIKNTLILPSGYLT